MRIVFSTLSHTTCWKVCLSERLSVFIPLFLNKPDLLFWSTGSLSSSSSLFFFLMGWSMKLFVAMKTNEHLLRIWQRLERKIKMWWMWSWKDFLFWCQILWLRDSFVISNCCTIVFYFPDQKACSTFLWQCSVILLVYEV